MRSHPHQTLIRRLASADLHAREQRDRQLQSALLQMRPTLAAGTEGRWKFDDVARGRTCWSQIADMMELAAANGVHREDVAAFGRALITYAAKLTPDEDVPRPFSVVLREEAEADAEADVAQAALMIAPSPSTRHAAIHTGERLIGKLSALVAMCRSQQYTTRGA